MSRYPSPDVWQQLEQSALKRRYTIKGAPTKKDVFGHQILGTANTEDQSMTGYVSITPYKLTSKYAQDAYEYYAFSVLVDHGVTNHEYNAGISIGYFGDHINLGITAVGDGADIVPGYKPDSTVPTETNTFSVDFNVQVNAGEDTSADAGVNVGWSTSYTLPAMHFDAIPADQSVTWQVQLPGYSVSEMRPQPLDPAWGGIAFPPQFIARFPKGNAAHLRIAVDFEWLYIYPLGTVADTKRWQETFDFVAGAYYVRDKVSGKVLDVRGGSTEEGANLIAFQVKRYDPDDITTLPLNQLWSVAPDGQIRNCLTGFCIDIAKANTGDGASVCLWPLNAGDNQRWTLNGQGSIVSHMNCGGTLVIASDGSVVVARRNGGIDPNPHWELVPMGTIA